MLIAVSARRTVPASVRRAVIERDGMTCRLCGRPVLISTTHRADRLHLDHVIPHAEGGADSVENLRVTCASCNLTRPRPLAVTVADRRIEVTRAGRLYWWPADFAPPRLLATRAPSWAVAHFKTALGLDAADVLGRVVRGELAASPPGRPIRVEVPGFVLRERERQQLIQEKLAGLDPRSAAYLLTSRGNRRRAK